MSWLESKLQNEETWKKNIDSQVYVYLTQDEGFKYDDGVYSWYEGKNRMLSIKVKIEIEEVE